MYIKLLIVIKGFYLKESFFKLNVPETIHNLHQEKQFVIIAKFNQTTCSLLDWYAVNLNNLHNNCIPIDYRM